MPIDALRDPCSETANDRANGRRVGFRALLWGMSFVAVAWAARFGELSPRVLALPALASGLLGLATFRAYLRFLRETDELRRKIEVEALSLGYGVGVIGGVTYLLLESSGLVADADLSYVLVAMMLAYSVAVVVARRSFS